MNKRDIELEMFEIEREIEQLTTGKTPEEIMTRYNQHCIEGLLIAECAVDYISRFLKDTDAEHPLMISAEIKPSLRVCDKACIPFRIDSIWRESDTGAICFKERGADLPVILQNFSIVQIIKVFDWFWKNYGGKV